MNVIFTVIFIASMIAIAITAPDKLLPLKSKTCGKEETFFSMLKPGGILVLPVENFLKILWNFRRINKMLKTTLYKK